jgi:tetratricopeptide (TPR) repeat protein
MVCKAVVPALLLCIATACSSPEQRRQLALQEADTAVAAGDLDRAVAALREHLRFAPNDLTVRTRLALLLEQQSRSCQALELLTSLPDHVALDLPARQALGRLLLGCRCFERCALVLVALEREAALAPEVKQELLREVARDKHGSAQEVARLVPAAWVRQLVLLCLSSGQLGEAIACLAQLPSDDPDRVDLTGQVLRHAYENDLLGKIEHKPELLEPGETPWQLLAHHQLLLRRNQWAPAIAIEQTFAERYPDHPQRYEILLAMARRAVRTGRYTLGLERADEAIRLNPDRTDALVVKGRALQSLGRNRQARLIFEQVLDTQPDHPVALRMVADERSEPSSIDLHLTATRTTSGG